MTLPETHHDKRYQGLIENARLVGMTEDEIEQLLCVPFLVARRVVHERTTEWMARSLGIDVRNGAGSE